MEAVSTLKTSDHRWSKLTKPSKRVSNRTNHHQKPSHGRADHLFADPAPTYPYSLLCSDLNNPYAQQPPRPFLSLPLLPSKPCNVEAFSYPPPSNSKSNKRPNNKSSSSSTSTSVHLPLTLKKSSPKPKHHPKKGQKINPKETAVSVAAPVVGLTECLGPDPGELPRGSFVSTKGNPTDLHSGKQEADDIDVELSCPFVYSLAPPPSSLPLPSFALRPKLGCNVTAAAAGVPARLLHPPSVKTNE